MTKKINLTMAHKAAAVLTTVFALASAYYSSDIMRLLAKGSNERAQEQIRLHQIFQAADVPAAQEALVKEVLFGQGGDCTRLGIELQKPCQAARDMLDIQYGERHVLAYKHQ